MNIKEAEQLSGVTRRNIRFYEQKGLLHPSRNRENDYREYTMEDVQTLKRIRALRMVDVPVEQIKQVLDEEKPLPIAAAEHCASLTVRIRQMETALRFCREFEHIQQLGEWDVDEVLQRMEAAENGQELPNRWNRDYIDGVLKYLDYLLVWAKVGQWVFGQGRGGSILFSVHALTIAAYILYAYSRYISETDLPQLLEAVVWIGCLPHMFALMPFTELVSEPYAQVFLPPVLLMTAFLFGALTAKWKTGALPWKDRSNREKV